MKKILVYKKAILAGLGVFGLGIMLGVFGVLATISPTPQIIEAKQQVVVYDDGTAEIIVRDKYMSDTYTTYRAAIPGIYIKSVRRKGYFAPELKHLGGNGERMVFTYTVQPTEVMSENERYRGTCSRGIFYIDRETHTSRTMLTESCIEHSLDPHDNTRYLGSLIDPHGRERSLVVGSLETGEIIASTTIPQGYRVQTFNDKGTMLRGVKDWEMETLVFSEIKRSDIHDTPGENQCSPYKIYALDIATSERTDITPNGDTYCSFGAPILVYDRHIGQEKSDSEGFAILKRRYVEETSEFIEERTQLNISE